MKKQQLEARVHNVKKLIASLTFQMSDVELAEENDKSNVVNLNEQKNKQKDLSSSIDLLTKKLDKLKKEGLKLGNDVS